MRLPDPLFFFAIGAATGADTGVACTGTGTGTFAILPLPPLLLVPACLSAAALDALAAAAAIAAAAARLSSSSSSAGSGEKSAERSTHSRRELGWPDRVIDSDGFMISPIRLCLSGMNLPKLPPPPPPDPDAAPKLPVQTDAPDAAEEGPLFLPLFLPLPLALPSTCLETRPR